MVVTQGHVYWANLRVPSPTPSQIITLDRELLTEEVRKLSKRQLELILTGIDIVLGR